VIKSTDFPSLKIEIVPLVMQDEDDHEHAMLQHRLEQLTTTARFEDVK
jgi:hypothetical protein